jgi:D-serine deaminase-like pyridoxal phosphate-dependent protein
MDLNTRTKACDESFKLVLDLKQKLESAGMKVPAIIAGGSPTFPIHAKRKGIECSPGTFIYWDKGYLTSCPEQSFLPAAVLVTRIISLPSPTRICTDLGHKSVAAENEIGRRVFFLNASDLTAVGQSEEHLVCETGSGHHHKTGDLLYGLPYHVCPTVALYEKVYTVENRKVTGEWKNVARDRKINV